MYIRKRGQFFTYEFFVNSKRYAGTFNGKNGTQIPNGKKEARDLAYEERRKVLDGTYRSVLVREEWKNFETFVDEVYLPFAREHHSPAAHDEFRCRVLKEHFKGKRFDEMTMMMVVKLINERLNSETVRKEKLDSGTIVNSKRSPTTVNKEITLLSSIFRMAMRERVASFNPCDELPKSVRSKIPARRRRNRRMSLDEERALFQIGCVGRREHLRDITEMAICTGMRKGELLRLRYDDLNLSSGTVSRVIKGEVWDIFPDWLLVEKTKNGRPRVIPMSQRVRGILARLTADAAVGDLVFTSIRSDSRITDIKKAFVSACEEAKIKNLTFHDLRHTWSSRAAEMGVPEHVRRDILGHSSKSMTGDYTHASPDEMERAMELVASYARKISAKSRQMAKRRPELRSAVAL
jgi:integrase